MSEQDKVPFSMKDAPTYRSKFTVQAQRIVLEGAKPDDEIEVPINGRIYTAHVGDYIVLLDDNRLELWTADRFEREFETRETDKSPEKPGRRIRFEVAP